MPRRKPFSSKQKKQQLQQKRQRKKKEGAVGTEKVVNSDLLSSSGDNSETEDGGQRPAEVEEGDGRHQLMKKGQLSAIGDQLDINKLNQQPMTNAGSGGCGRLNNPNRYRLHFESESREEMERRKRLAKSKTVKPLPDSSLEVSVDDIYAPGTVLDIPKRPPWSYSMTKEQVETQEEAMFEEYLKKIYSEHKPERLSYFEHNLETWRQLWRVLEISDVVVLVADIRHPALHFSPALYDYVVKDLKKSFVLVLNKVDLVPPQVAVAWRHYFLSKFPQLYVVCFTSFPDQEASTQTNRKSVRLKFKRGGRGRLPLAVGPTELFQVIETMYRGKIDLDGWRERLSGDKDTPTSPALNDDTSSDSGSEGEEPVAMQASTTESSPLVSDDAKEHMLTIGMVGHPNVGKSSLINGLLGKKLVSTSRTPGHTKHFQTLFLTRSIRLCDCPGLVFPSLVDRSLQILSGIYPIAQVKEPYTVVSYLVQRVPLVQLLRLEHPEGKVTEYKRTAGRRLGDCDLKYDLDPKLFQLNLKDKDHEAMWRKIEEEREWTAWNICDAWAERQHYYTSRAARLDTYRAANSLLRLAADGRICLFFRPPGYSKEKASWEAHPEVLEMIELQRRGMTSSTNARPAGQVDKGGESVMAIGDQTTNERGSEPPVVVGNKFELPKELHSVS